MSQKVELKACKIWRPMFLGAALLGCMMAPGQVLADVPPLRPGDDSIGPVNGALVDKLLSDAQKALKSGNIRLALINLKNAVSAAPHNGTARARLGTVLLQAGDAPGAERELRQARRDGAPELVVLPPLFEVMLGRNEAQLLLDQFPDPGPSANGAAAPDILKARALALQALKRSPEAIDAMDRSLALRRDGHGLLTRARLSLMQGRSSEATKYADEAIAKSNASEAMLFRIGMLLAANDNSGALDLANKLLIKYPGDLQGRFARIEAYISLRQDAKAKVEVDDIVAKFPAAYLGTYYEALLLARAGDAKGAWNFAQTLPGEFRDAQPRIGLVVAQMAVDSGNEETGASILDRMLTLNPGLVVARARLAAIRLKQNSPRSALDVLEPVKDSADPRVLELLCNIYLKMNRNNDALDALRRLGAVAKGRADAQRSIALLEIQMGQTDQGIKDLSQVVSRDPFNATLVGPLVNGLAQARRYGEALAVADRMGTDPKNHSQALVYRGSILALQRDLAGAQAAFDKAVKDDPKNVSVLYSRAEFLASQQRLVDANRDLRAILSLDAKNMPAFMKLAEIAAQQGQDQDVRTILNQAIASSPGDATPRLSLMRYLNARQRFKETLTVAGDLQRTQPNNTDSLALVGQAQFSLGQKKESVATYRRLVSLMPTAAAPLVLLGNALSVAGDRTGAARALEAAVKLSPDVPDVKGAQINLLFSQGSVDAAVASARAFRAAYPGTTGDIMLGDTLDRAKSHDEAVAVLGKSFSDKPNAAVLLRLVRFAVQANDRKRAGDLMSTWLSANPNDAGVRQEYAMLLMQQNSNVQAVAQFQAILKQDPNNVIALNNLGWLLQTSDPKQALALLSRAQTLSPNSPDVADTLGWFKVQQKDAAGGLALLSRAHAMAPQDGGITFHLVQAMDANSQREAARKLLSTLLTSGVKFNDQPAAVKLAAAWR